MADLKKADLEDAKRRGLRSALPQGGPGTKSKRESHWDNIIGFFGEGLNLADVTPTELARYTRPRAGPAAINRDVAVFRPALRLARRHKAESGYRGNPFEDWERLKEVKRPPKDLPAELSARLVREAYALARKAIPRCRVEWLQAAQVVDLWDVTLSRHREVLWARREWIEGHTLTFPPHKGGKGRVFPILWPSQPKNAGEDRRARRLGMILAAIPVTDSPWLFPSLRSPGRPRHSLRTFWRRLGERVGIPDLRPHDLRHSGASQDFRAGATVEQVQRVLGHKTPQMAQQTYIRLFPEQVKRPAARLKAATRRTSKNLRTRKKRRK